jgi:hypothetical protein
MDGVDSLVAARAAAFTRQTGDSVTTLDILREARALISHPDRWTRRALARDWRQFRVPPESPQAVSFCAIGALQRVTAGRVDWKDVAVTRAFDRTWRGSLLPSARSVPRKSSNNRASLLLHPVMWKLSTNRRFYVDF